MSANTRAWRRWVLLATLFAIGLVWIAAFALFRARGGDFIAARLDDAARDRARVPTTALPLVYVVGQGKPGAQLLGNGWHWPEEVGAWSWEPRASVFMRWPPANGERWLTFEGDAFVPGKRGQHVRLYVDGELAGEWFAHRDDTVVRESVKLLRPPVDGVTKLTFEVDAVASPFRTDGAPDDRHLGFRLRTLELRDLPAGASPPP